jgi:GGDEF domain-containing protein
MDGHIPALIGYYDYRLVALSVLIAIFAAYVERNFSQFETSLNRTVASPGVSKLVIRHGSQHLGAVTVSIGVACYPTHGSTLKGLITAADRALYKAKADGRNCVVAAISNSICETLSSVTHSLVR